MQGSKVREPALKTPRSVKGEGKRYSRSQSRRCPVVSEDHIRADLQTAAREEHHVTADGAGLKEAATHGEPTQEQAAGMNCAVWRTAHAGAVCS